jgi:predicted AlkP superfamily phosphohydrolase/phosphomutase
MDSRAREQAVQQTAGDSARRPVLLLIGWDGATPELLLRFAQAGKLPTVARLIQGGSFRRLRSTIPPVTACAWSSFLTGKNPGKHGLFDFVTPHPNSYKFAYTHGGYRRGRGGDLLALLNGAGLRVGCVNVPMTYPPRAIDGFLVSGLDAPDESSGIACPAEVFAQAQAEVGPYRIDNRHLGSMKDGADRRRVLDEFKRIETRRTDVALAMMRHVPVDVLILVYNATDQVQHHFWHLMEPQTCAYPGSDAAMAALFQHAIEEVYAHCDAELARWLELFPQANLMLISDHGAGPVCGPQVRLNSALAEAGLLTWAQTKGTLLSDAAAGLDRFLRRTLTAGQKAKLARLLPAGRTRIEALGLPTIDWQRTVAFAYEGFTLSPCVWINRRDRFPEGTVGAGEEYEQACSRVIEALGRLKDPKTGAAVIPRVYRSAEVYHGEYTSGAPDLILDWWEGATFTMAKSHPKLNGQPAVFYPTQPARAGQDITGIHRRDGVLVAAGSQWAALDSAQTAPADLIDIAPTVLASLGLEVPADMDGRVLTDVVGSPAVPQRHAIGPPAPPAAAPVEKVQAYSQRDERRIEERLSDLGYM